MLYSTRGDIVAVIAKDYQQSKIITRVYDCSRMEPRLKMQSEKKSIIKAKDYLFRKFHFEDFNCLEPIPFITQEHEKRILEKIKATFKDQMA